MDEHKRRRYLKAMGITLWQQRWSPQQVFKQDESAPAESAVTHQLSASPSFTQVTHRKVTAEELPNEHSETNNFNPAERKLTDPAPHEFLSATPDEPAEHQITSLASDDTDDRVIRISQMDWGSLETEVSGCVACDLHKSRTQTVFGVGNRQAAWMIIGEAPGADEDRLGEPFVGRAGKLLDAMLQALRLNREKVFIANILKCRPPKNRDPLPQEARCCWPFLKRQIMLINPRIIFAVGRIAAQNLLQTEVPVGKLRNRVHRLSGTEIPIIVSYHPAYLLRSPREKRKAWDDLQLAQRIASHAL